MCRLLNGSHHAGIESCPPQFLISNHQRGTHLAIVDKVVTTVNITTTQLSKLDLCALSREHSRSEMTREILDRHLPPTAKMVQAVVERLWYEYKKSDHTFSNFLKLSIDWLGQKNINQFHIDLIIPKLKELDGKDN